jgi:hypothetical protein
MKNPEKEFPKIKDMNKDEVFVKVAYLKLNGKNVPVFVGKIIKKCDIDNFTRDHKEKYNTDFCEAILIDREC